MLLVHHSANFWRSLCKWVARVQLFVSSALATTTDEYSPWLALCRLGPFGGRETVITLGGRDEESLHATKSGRVRSHRGLYFRDARRFQRLRDGLSHR